MDPEELDVFEMQPGRGLWPDYCPNCGGFASVGVGEGEPAAEKVRTSFDIMGCSEVCYQAVQGILDENAWADIKLAFPSHILVQCDGFRQLRPRISFLRPHGAVSQSAPSLTDLIATGYKMLQSRFGKSHKK